MGIIVIGVVRTLNPLILVVLSSLYSLLMACLFLSLDAVDVAMTEAAVGAGVSTVLFLCCLNLIGSKTIKANKFSWAYWFVSLLVACLLVFGVFDLPVFGIAETPVHTNISSEFLSRGLVETGVPNIVTAILASYRGFDTLGEVIVIFIAGLGVLGILKK